MKQQKRDAATNRTPEGRGSCMTQLGDQTAGTQSIAVHKRRKKGKKIQPRTLEQAQRTWRNAQRVNPGANFGAGEATHSPIEKRGDPGRSDRRPIPDKACIDVITRHCTELEMALHPWEQPRSRGRERERNG